jgi:hypothetical protein
MADAASNSRLENMVVLLALRKIDVVWAAISQSQPA